jgi:anti-sigma factor RsiW
MRCQEIRPLLHAFLDDELDLVRSVEIRQHLESCPECAREEAARRALRSALRDDRLRFRIPGGVEARVRAALRAEGAGRGAQAPGVIARAARSHRPLRWSRWMFLPAGAMAGLLVVATLALWNLGRATPGPSADELASREVVANHVRSLMASHLTDVSSTDQHTVKPWFNGRLDFSPPVTDLADHEFALVGGRLDYLAGQSVAALVYQRRRHVINLLVAPAPGEPDRPVAAMTRQGYHLLHWSRGGLGYWAVSDLNEGELREFADLIRR